MWTCIKCGEEVEDQFDACWKCGAGKDGSEPMDESQEQEASRDAEPGGNADGKLVTIAEYKDEAEAHLACQLLADWEIKSVVIGANTANVYPIAPTFSGFIKLQIFERQFQRAFEILRAHDKPESKELNIKCPQCGRMLFGATREMIGHTGVCQKCRTEFIIRDS